MSEATPLDAKARASLLDGVMRAAFPAVEAQANDVGLATAEAFGALGVWVLAYERRADATLLKHVRLPQETRARLEHALGGPLEGRSLASGLPFGLRSNRRATITPAGRPVLAALLGLDPQVDRTVLEEAVAQPDLRCATATVVEGPSEVTVALLSPTLQDSDLAVLELLLSRAQRTRALARAQVEAPADRRPASLEAQTLFELGRAVASEQDLPHVLELAVDSAAALSGADDVFLFIPGQGSGTRSLVFRTCVHRAGPGATGRGHALREEAATVALAALRQMRVDPTPSLESAGGYFEAAPLFSGARPLGCLVAVRLPHWASAGPFSEGDRRRLRAVADYVTVALQAAALFARQQHHANEVGLLNEVANESAELGLDGFLPAVTERICRSLEFDLAALLFVDHERAELRWGWGFRPDGPLPLTRLRYPAEAGLAGRALRSRQPRRGDVSELSLPELRVYAEQSGLQYFAAIPLYVKGRSVGVVIVGRKNRPIDEDEMRLLVAVCVQVAVAADNARLFAETRRRAADVGLIQSIGNAMARSLDPDFILRQAITHLSDALECDGIAVYRRRGAVFESVVQSGPLAEGEIHWTRFADGNPVTAAAMASAQAVEFLTTALDEPTRSNLRALGVGRIAAVPLRLTAADHADARTGALGVLVVARRTTRAFGESELGVLSAVAGQLTISLRNADLFEETRRRAEDLTIVNEAGRALLGGAPLAEALRGVAEQIARLVNVRTCTFLLVDHERSELQGTAPVSSERRAGVAVAEIRVPLSSDTIASRAVRSRAPATDRELGRHPSVFAPSGVDWEPRWGVALPLQSQDQVLGVIVLVDSDTRRELTPAEVERVMAVGNQVAIAIDRSRLTARLEQSLIELADAQQQLVRRERLAALGGLAALVAHEVRNPLGVIVNSLGLLAKLTNLTGDARRIYEIMREETGRLDQIVTDMLDYTRPTEPRLVPANLTRVLGDAVASASAAERNRGTSVGGITTSVLVAPDLPSVPLDERLLHQALVNLLSNAYQSLNGLGNVRLEGALSADGHQARISVEDDGPGISSEIKSRLFEPFFTTKAKGSGLGLAMVKRIVDSHHGEISVETSPGKGTRFTIELPLVRSGPQRALEASPPYAVAG